MYHTFIHTFIDTYIHDTYMHTQTNTYRYTNRQVHTHILLESGTRFQILLQRQRLVNLSEEKKLEASLLKVTTHSILLTMAFIRGFKFRAISPKGKKLHLRLVFSVIKQNTKSKENASL